MEAQEQRTVVLRAEALAHDPRPHAPRRPELGDLLEEVIMAVEEERELSREPIDIQASVDSRLHVGDAVGEGETDLLRGGRARLTDVVAADADCVPVW